MIIGILQRATTAKENTDNAQIKERIQLAYHSALTGGQGSYTKESLEEELEKEFGENNYNVDDSDNKNWTLSAKGQEVIIPAGKKGTNPSGKLSKEQLKAKIEAEDNDCMIDEDGNIIPINAWSYEITGDSSCILADSYEDDGEDYYNCAYKGEVINGKLKYNIPVYIKIENKSYKVIELGPWALRELEIDTITIPDNITRIGASTFRYCFELTNITISENVTYIGDEAFRECNKLENVSIPNDVTIINYGLFRDCTALSNVTLPDNLSEIVSYAFYNCTNLSSLVIPSTVTEIHAPAFTNVPHIYYNGPALDSDSTHVPWGALAIN